jgi:hypothetical protein
MKLRLCCVQYRNRWFPQIRRSLHSFRGRCWQSAAGKMILAVAPRGEAGESERASERERGSDRERGSPIPGGPERRPMTQVMKG